MSKEKPLKLRTGGDRRAASLSCIKYCNASYTLDTHVLPAGPPYGGQQVHTGHIYLDIIIITVVK